MTAGAVTKAGRSPSLKLLLGLSMAVLLTHLLLLQDSPLRFGVKPQAGKLAARAFLTRTIEPAPAPVATLVTPMRPVAAAVRPQRAPGPKITPNRTDALDPATPAAIDIIANESRPSLADGAATSLSGSPAQPDSSATPDTPNLANVTRLQATTPSASATATVTSATASVPAGPKTTPVTAMNLPASALLKYKVTGGSKGLNYYANAELTWRNSGAQYDASLRISAFLLGARSMTSIGAVTKDGLAPTRFADKFKSEVAAHFEADKGKITFSANTPDAPWIEGAQDRVSVFMQLAGMLAGKPGEFPPGSSITLYTVGPRDADTWTFLVEAEENLQLPAGDMAALKLTRKPRKEYDQKVEIWYAPSMNYLPVRNRITQQNGDFVDQQLTGIAKP